MWLRLGEGELINLDFAVSIKKSDPASIEIFLEGGANRTVMFETAYDRDQAFEAFKNNLVKLRLAME